MTLTPHIVHILLLVIVSALGVRQIPLDIRQRVLSRRATFIGTVAVVVVIIVDTSATSDAHRTRMALAWMLAIGGAYFAVHQFSTTALGLGDVFLVIPLTLAVSYAASDLVVVWQLAAAVSAVAHVLLIRVTRGASTIPFGPHLLVAAWLVLVFSV